MTGSCLLFISHVLLANIISGSNVSESGRVPPRFFSAIQKYEKYFIRSLSISTLGSYVRWVRLVLLSCIDGSRGSRVIFIPRDIIPPLAIQKGGVDH
jgi:hypothetical protein